MMVEMLDQTQLVSLKELIIPNTSGIAALGLLFDDFQGRISSAGTPSCG